MAVRRKPIFGVISLTLMLGLGVAAVLAAIYETPPAPSTEGESFAVAMAAIADIVVTLLVIGSVSIIATIFAGISLLRRETRWPAAVALCLALSSLATVVFAVSKL